MRFYDSWFLRAGFIILVISASVLLTIVGLKEYGSARFGSVAYSEMAATIAGMGLQLGVVLMIAGVTMIMYRKARLRNPRLH